MTTPQIWNPNEAPKERVALYFLAIGVFVVLGYLAIRAYLSLAGLVSNESTQPTVIWGFSMSRPVAACLIAGALGGALSALLSAANRLAHGLESWAGKKHPDATRPDKFSLRMAPFFLIRPVLGASMGFVVYVGIVSGLLFATKQTDKNPNQEGLSLEALAFYSTLAGLFAKTLLERLKIMFKSFVGVTDGGP